MKIFTMPAVLLLLMASCSEDKNANAGKSDAGSRRGGIIRVNEVEKIRSLRPESINEINGFHIASQVYEGLVKYNQADLTIRPALAKSWQVSADGLEYTFVLRTSAKFADDSCFSEGRGRNLKAEDVSYSFTRLCMSNPNNTQYHVTFKDRVAGASDVHDGKAGSLAGVVVVNDSTVRVKLLNPDINFLNVLTMPGCYIQAKEAVEFYKERLSGKCIGTGPFFIHSVNPEGNIVMKRNDGYWAKDSSGNSLPYADEVHWSFINDKQTELAEFRKGNIDVIHRVPVGIFRELTSELQDGKGKNLNFDIYSSPGLTTHFFGFNYSQNKHFSREVRRAFNLAIDRQQLADVTLAGSGMPAEHGVVPYTDVFSRLGYSYKDLKGYTYNVDSAKKLLAKAGYPGGKGFPAVTLSINNGGGDRNVLLAVAVQKMLKDNLGVNVNFDVKPWPQHVDDIQSGNSEFFRYAWIGDYPDPESFLTIFYGKHVPENANEKSPVNCFRFRNSRFDSLFEAARVEKDMKKRLSLLSAAEQVVIDEAPVMPLFYDENYRLVRKGLKNIPENLLSYMDLGSAYFDTGRK